MSTCILVGCKPTNKQFNPNGSKLGSWNSKVDNWHLILETLELNVTFEDIYAVKDHWLHLQGVHQEFWKAGNLIHLLKQECNPFHLWCVWIAYQTTILNQVFLLWDILLKNSNIHIIWSWWWRGKVAENSMVLIGWESSCWYFGHIIDVINDDWRPGWYNCCCVQLTLQFHTSTCCSLSRVFRF